MIANIDMQIKMVLVGDCDVGKSSLVHVFINKQFPQHCAQIPFQCKSAYVRKNNNIVKLCLWDTACGSQYDQIRPLHYFDTDIFMICFSINNPQSFQNAIKKWVKEIDEFNSNVQKIFICTKIDSVQNDFITIDFNTKPTLPYSMIQNRINAMGYELISCSSICKEGVEKCFNKAAELVMKKKLKSEQFNNNQLSGQCLLI